MDKEKYFLIGRGELEEVWNAEFYKQEFLINRDKIRKYKNGFSRLGKLTKKITKGETPLWRGDKYVSQGVLFVRSENVLENELSISQPTFIHPEVHKRMKRSQLHKNDVLLNIVGASIGRSCLYNLEREGNINQAVAIIRLKDGYNPRFLTYLFNSLPLQTQINQLKSGGARDNIDLHQIHKFEIPNCSLEIQNEVVNNFETAISLRRSLEIKAKNILKEIDSYLLKELNVVMPAQPVNSIQNRIFKTGWQKVTGNRFDPKKYSLQSESLIACIENSKLRKAPLKSLVIHSVAGDWGLDEKEEVNPKLFTKCLVIRATEFDNNYNLNIENSRAKFRLISNTKLKKLDIKPQDFLLEKSGGSPDQPVGRISILGNELLENHTIAYSNFIHKFRVNINEVVPEFLFCFLKTIHNIKLTDVMQSQTNGIRNLIMREYWNQSIILPDKKKQKEIADTIYQMRAEAKRTEIDAEKGFEQTKKEIENLILA